MPKVQAEEELALEGVRRIAGRACCFLETAVASHCAVVTSANSRSRAIYFRFFVFGFKADGGQTNPPPVRWISERLENG